MDGGAGGPGRSSGAPAAVGMNSSSPLQLQPLKAGYRQDSEKQGHVRILGAERRQGYRTADHR